MPVMQVLLLVMDISDSITIEAGHVHMQNAPPSARDLKADVCFVLISHPKLPT
jgi:hypothetical protein